VGSAVLVAGFLLPTVRATGPEGGRFMQHLMGRRRLPVYLAIAMLLTVLSGFVMYARVAAATNGAWAGYPAGDRLWPRRSGRHSRRGSRDCNGRRFRSTYGRDRAAHHRDRQANARAAGGDGAASG
jgi:hypothetical protein